MSCIRSAIRRFGRIPSFVASSFTTTAPRTEISRVLTLIVTVGFGAGACPCEAMIFIVVAVFIETDENPARRPPTRVTGRGGGVGAAGLAGATGADLATGFTASFFKSFFASFLTSFSFLGSFLARACCCFFIDIGWFLPPAALRSLPCSQLSSSSSSKSSASFAAGASTSSGSVAETSNLTLGPSGRSSLISSLTGFFAAATGAFFVSGMGISPPFSLYAAMAR